MEIILFLFRKFLGELAAPEPFFVIKEGPAKKPDGDIRHIAKRVFIFFHMGKHSLVRR